MLYDVTTLHFEAKHEDELPKVGNFKECRVDPQILVGLLVDRAGFPLEIGCYEGNKAETATSIPIIRQFQERHSLVDMVVVADAGMLSASNLDDLDQAGLRFIVGSRVSKAQADLASHFRWHGDAFDDGQIVDTITPTRGHGSRAPATTKRRRPSQSEARACTPGPGGQCGRTPANARPATATLTLQENRTRAVVAGEKTAPAPRVVTLKTGTQSLDGTSLARARSWSG